MLTARIFPVASQELTRAEIRLEARGAETEWGAVTNLQLSIQAVSLATQTNLVTADMALLAGQAQTRWGSAFNTRFTAHWVHSLTNAVPLSGEGHLLCDYAETQYGSAKNFQVSGRLATLSGPPPRQSDDSWAWWADIEPYSLEWECRLADLRSPKIDADEITAAGRWCAPGLEITNLHARLYQARLDARASLDVATRALKANVTSDVDPFKFNPHFTPGLQHWLSQYSWVEPPDLQASVALVLPAWTNRQPDWRAEVRPTLRMEGQFSLPHGGAFRGVTATAASSHFSYSNFVWRLPDLVVIRPEGRIEAFHEAQELTKDYYCKVRSSIDPKTLRSILNTAAQRDLDLFTFSQPPLINAEIQGRWNDQTLTAFRGEVALTNFTFRGESADAFQTRLEYTNRFLLLTEARLQRSAEWLSASSLAVDFAAQKIYLTNGFGRMDVQVFTRTIGPEVARTMEPYRFDRPPTARAYGIIPMRAEDDADMYFDVEGGPFHWLRFNVPHVAGQVHWVGDRLTISNVLADFYGGRAGGSAALRFGSDNGTEFQFALSVTNSQLQPLMADVSTVSNRLEGTLSGNLVVTRANSDDWRSWQGYGAVDLRDGLVWAIPIFGVFSPVLDAVAPGLGSSRATDAAGHFTITNGVIVSDDLEIRSPAMRLAYRGEVDLQGQVNARVEAELLRDMWLVGPVVSSVFWPVEKLFEYEASGSLSQPRTEPVYFLPKLVLMPFHPIRTIKGLFPEDNSPPSTSTNSPSAHP